MRDCQSGDKLCVCVCACVCVRGHGVPFWSVQVSSNERVCTVCVCMCVRVHTAWAGPGCPSHECLHCARVFCQDIRSTFRQVCLACVCVCMFSPASHLLHLLPIRPVPGTGQAACIVEAVPSDRVMATVVLFGGGRATAATHTHTDTDVHDRIARD